ncbi:beta-lactamase [Salinarchaeum sp. Harcht-Bsk1]|uniref:MBL fold metallo-hydrolase n=1 Tax=Salinarchaeum sp. Harcht-Bsk1 TaxID=1333523 RepID=UPI0003424187|nr:MBL fold metallo-hydrolase [Salinarchaeum sp. Harcht-Bsk1]AGN00651.1 beta-lactamase [Salinarchaeum sp. Harcht-Bsk1]
MAESIEPVDLAERIARGERIGIVDVRNREEFEEWHVEGPAAEVSQIPHAQFLQAQVRGGAADLVADVPEPIVTVCAIGEASDHAAELLRDAGLDAMNLTGGMEAWADVLLARSLDAPDGAEIMQYQRPATGCLGYLVVDGEEAAVVDPLGAFADRYPDHAAESGAELRYAIDTHVHADHVSGVADVAERSDAEPAIPAGAWDRGFDSDLEYTALDDGDVLELGEQTTIRAIHAPGHTGEMTALLVERAGGSGAEPESGDRPGTLLTGDSLFVDGVARPDLEADVDPEEAAATLHETLQALRERLPSRTLVAPGHVKQQTEPTVDGTYVAELGTLAERLEAFDLDADAFVRSVTDDLPPPPANAERIVAANLGHEAIDDLDEIELGPNNCAA